MRFLPLLLSITLLLGGCSTTGGGQSEGAMASAPAFEGRGTVGDTDGDGDADIIVAGKRAAGASRVSGVAMANPFGAASADPFAAPAPPASTVKPAPNAGDVAPDKGGIQRKIVYTASLGLRVANKRSATELVNAIIKKHDGFVQRSSLDEITFRVKPDRFDKAIEELEGLGEVTQRNVNSNDITEQYTDIELRLETAHSSRQRLIALMEKTNATKDVIEIERDIRRLTEEIETMKGRLRVLADQVDLATVTVRLEEKFLDQASSPRRQSTPFSWMAWTGIETTLAPIAEGTSMSRHGLFQGPKFQLATPDEAPAPEGFVPLHMTRLVVIAGTPEDFRLRARFFTVPESQKGSIEFWAKAMESELASNRGYLIRKSAAFEATDAELEAWRVETEVTFSGEKWLYDLWIVREKDEPQEFVTVEFARLKSSEPEGGKADALDRVLEAVKGIRL